MTGCLRRWPDQVRADRERLLMARIVAKLTGLVRDEEKP
jgi:hypothetical protein